MGRLKQHETVGPHIAPAQAIALTIQTEPLSKAASKTAISFGDKKDHA